MPRPELYPLSFVPIYKEKVWGGRRLETMGRDLPGSDQTAIGESWELVDLAQTSTSGGGGNAEHSVVRNGPLAGQTLDQVIAAYGDDLLGGVPLSPEGGFPLLLKYLDANTNLSVQVHPSPSYAAGHPEAFLKSEAWYIVDCDPGAVIYKGVKDGVSPEQFRAALEANTDDAVTPLLISVPVRPGDCHYLPSGTCHALGGGILVAEVQTPSDTTFRVYDWGRTGRELHIEPALACVSFGPAETEAYEQRAISKQDGIETQRLVTCEFFTIQRCQSAEATARVEQVSRPTMLMVLAGTVRVGSTAEAAEPEVFSQGDTVLLPASLGQAELTTTAGARWLEIGFTQSPTDNAVR